jgi:HK97 family phage major capsid protein
MTVRNLSFIPKRPTIMSDARFHAGVTKILRERAAQGAHMDPAAYGFSHLLSRALGVNEVDHAAADYAQHLSDPFKERFGEPRHGGFYVPMNIRTLNASSGQGLIANELGSELIPSLVPNSAVVASGARTVVIKQRGSFSLPRVATGATVTVTTDGNVATVGDPSIDQCTLTPFTVSANINFSRRLHLQNAYESALSGDLQRRAFAELDRLILAGSGTGAEPTGILSNSNVATYEAGTNGAAPSLAKLTDIEYELGSVYSGGEQSWFVNSAIRRKVRNTATAAGLSPLWNSQNQLLGYRTNVTEHIPSDLTKGTGTGLSASILGDFSNVLIGFWAPAFEVVVNPFASSGKVAMTIFMDVGFGLLRDEAFIKCVDFVA